MKQNTYILFLSSNSITNMIHLKKIKLCSELLKTIGMQMLICLGIHSKLTLEPWLLLTALQTVFLPCGQATLSYYEKRPGRGKSHCCRVKF